MDASTEDSASAAEIFEALESVGADGSRPDFKELIGRAEASLDEAAADEHCHRLVERLTEDASDIRALEAVVVIGMARPEATIAHRIPVTQEAKRLAVLLEKSGDADRAQAVLEALLARNPADRSVERELSSLMRRNGNLARLVERYLARAEECIREGRRDEAVRWLREVLMLDPQRRDVARMIRDLNYADLERKGAWRKGLKATAVSMLCLASLSGVVWREISIDRRFESIPQAKGDDLNAMQARLSALDELVDQSPLWMGLFRVSRERAALRENVERMRAERAEEEAAQAQARALALTLAESQYSLAKLAAQHYEFEQMLEHLQASLSYAPDDWSERAQVQREIAALAELKQVRPSTPKGAQK